MDRLMSGARIELDPGADRCVIAAGRGSPALAAATIVRRPGRTPEITVVKGAHSWDMAIPTDADAAVSLVLFMTDDSEIGRVEDRGSLTCRVGAHEFELDTRSERHGALMIAETYHRNGKRMMRVRGDGWSFGVKAMARKEDLPIEAFLPETQAYEGTPDTGGGPSDGRSGNGGAKGSGSGVIVAPNHVITNAHVVRGMRRHTVHGHDDDVIARVLAVDEKHDLALLRATGIGGTAMALRTDKPLYLGEDVVAAGFPLRDILGDTLKLTRGAVSGMTGIEGDVGSFQFSAPIGSGSSGGAMTDAEGNLVGVITSALAHDRMRQAGATSENMNFAVKVALVAEMLAAHDVDWSRPVARTLDQSAITRAIRQSVVAISVA